MGNGYWHKVLRINLTSRTSSVDEVGEETWKELLGGSGYGAKVLLEETPPAVDPLSPENKIIVALGLFQAVRAPGSAKWSLVTKSPLTGTYLDTAGGAFWGTRFKGLGYDALIIEGKSDTPAYVYITTEKVVFGDASHLWGMDNYQVFEKINDHFGGETPVSALTIGPAGEKCNPIACVTGDGFSFAGRGGSGAVMGSKNLKAVIVSDGKETVPVHDRETAERLSKEVMKKLAEDGARFRTHGTPGAVVSLEALGDTPIKYWRGDVWSEGAEKIGAPNYTKILEAKPKFCANCPAGCHRHIKVKQPAKWSLEGPGPEYETLGMIGDNLLNDDLPSICKVNEICNQMGTDTISTGAFIGFLMECFEKGILTKEDTSGREIHWGDGEIIVDLAEEIARMEGMGTLFKKGILGAVNKLGEEKTGDIAVQVKNLDLPAHDPRAAFGISVNYATSTRGACHERGDAQFIQFNQYYPEMGMEEPFNRFDMKYAARAAYYAQNTSAIYNSISLCKFMVKGAGMTLTQINQIMNAITGWNWSVEEMVRSGERIFALQRLINVRDGIRKKDDHLPRKVFIPASEGPRKGQIPEPFEPALAEYYDLRGWDEEGIPTPESLKELDLEAYIRFLP